MEPPWLLTLLYLMARTGFYLLGGVTLLAALGVTLTRNLFHSALCLAVALLGVAGLYLYLAAEFLAVVQILIYVGAILTLLIFGVMLTARIADPTIPNLNRQVAAAALVALGAGWALISALRRAAALPHGPIAPVPLETLGRGLVTAYVLPFEVVSLILVAALVGAIVIARPEQACGEAPSAGRSRRPEQGRP